jgi:hypothetical protein
LNIELGTLNLESVYTLNNNLDYWLYRAILLIHRRFRLTMNLEKNRLLPEVLVVIFFCNT